jgi:hypothetical protein
MFKKKPTRTHIIESHWMEYLQWVKDQGEKTQCRPSDRAFWKWYLKNKVERRGVPDA